MPPANSSAYTSVLRFLARLPGIVAFFFYLWLIPHVWTVWPKLPIAAKGIYHFQQHAPWVSLVIFFSLALWGFLYLKREWRWWDLSFLIINMAIILICGITLLMLIFNIDPMPRQM